MKTREEVAKELQDENLREDWCEKLAWHWWEGMDMDDAQETFVFDAVHGRPSLLEYDDEEILEALLEADLIEDDEQQRRDEKNGLYPGLEDNCN